MIDRTIKRSLGQMMKGVEVVGARHAGVARAYTSHWVSQVSFEQDETRMVTWLMLKTSDRPGLLSLVGQAFAANKLRLHNARIATAGAEAQDAFAITDLEDQPITDPERLSAISESLCGILDG